MNEQWLTDRIVEIDAHLAKGEITEDQARGRRWMARAEAGSALEDEQFFAYVDAFVAKCQVRLREEYARTPNVTVPLLSTMIGPRYVRVVRSDGVSRHAYCFLDRRTGFVLKCDGWKSPAKGPRGTILDPDAAKWMSTSGAPYAR